MSANASVKFEPLSDDVNDYEEHKPDLLLPVPATDLMGGDSTSNAPPCTSYIKSEPSFDQIDDHKLPISCTSSTTYPIPIAPSDKSYSTSTTALQKLNAGLLISTGPSTSFTLIKSIPSYGASTSGCVKPTSSKLSDFFKSSGGGLPFQLTKLQSVAIAVPLPKAAPVTPIITKKKRKKKRVDELTPDELAKRREYLRQVRARRTILDAEQNRLANQIRVAKKFRSMTPEQIVAMNAQRRAERMYKKSRLSEEQKQRQREISRVRQRYRRRGLRFSTRDNNCYFNPDETFQRQWYLKESPAAKRNAQRVRELELGYKRAARAKNAEKNREMARVYKRKYRARKREELSKNVAVGSPNNQETVKPKEEEKCPTEVFL